MGRLVGRIGREFCFVFVFLFSFSFHLILLHSSSTRIVAVSLSAHYPFSLYTLPVSLSTHRIGTEANTHNFYVE